MSAGADWRPTAAPARLAARARLLARARAFFAERQVLEVDTPLIVNAAVSDVHIHAAEVRLAGPHGAPHFLHTSPEYAMKRLLAAGSGDIYQICHVARGFEAGRLHNPEFTLIEWYRLGFSLSALMDEVDSLVRALLAEGAGARRSERVSYREVFQRCLGLDPFSTSAPELARAAAAAGFSGGAASTRDECLELLMGAQIGPTLGRGGLTFVYGYPASQAALARLDPQDPQCGAALRAVRGRDRARQRLPRAHRCRRAARTLRARAGRARPARPAGALAR